MIKLKSLLSITETMVTEIMVIQFIYAVQYLILFNVRCDIVSIKYIEFINQFVKIRLINKVRVIIIPPNVYTIKSQNKTPDKPIAS